MSLKKQNTALIVIDAQNDFHDIPSAALPVPGSSKDIERLSNFIINVTPDKIFASQDSHYPLSIFHPTWFYDSQNKYVKPFTQIKADDVRNGKYVARIDPVRTLMYLENLELNGEFTHMIWPEHCLMGTEGHNLHPVFFEAITLWMKKQSDWVNFIVKGVNPYTEHFGIFRANVPIPEDSANTDVNQGIFMTINKYNTVYLGGQARTHCVVNSLRQMLQIAPQLATKIVVLEDCMSDVAGLPDDFYDYVDSIYSDAKAKGVQFAKSTDI